MEIPKALQLTGLGASFNISMIYGFAFYLDLIAGAVFLLLRLIRVLRSNVNFIYILVGTLNLCVGVLAVILFFLGKADMAWLNKCLISLLVGFLIIADTLLSNNRNARTKKKK